MPITVTRLNSIVSTFNQNVGSAFLDTDNIHAWLFEYNGGHFAYVDVTTNVVTFEGNISNGANRPTSNGVGTMLFIQDGTTYYSVVSDTITNTLLKFHIAAGPIGGFLNGNSVTDASLDCTSQIGSNNGVLTNGYAYGKSSGTNYLVMCTIGPSQFDNCLISAVNADTMALIGTIPYTHAGTRFQTNNVTTFMDKFGVFWTILNGSSGTDFISWNPANGTSGGHINVTVTNVPTSVVPIVGDSGQSTLLATYIASNHSVLITNTGPNVNPGHGFAKSYTGQVIGVSLTTFLQTSFHADDGVFSFNNSVFQASSTGSGEGARAGMVQGIQSDGLLCIEQQLSAFDPVQNGGVISLINPVTLAIINTYNVTQLVQTAGFIVPLCTGVSTASASSTLLAPLQTMKYSSVAGAVLVAFGIDPNGSSAYYITGIGVHLVSIDVTPHLPSIAVAATEQFIATGHFSDSTTQDLTTASTWTSGTPGHATIVSNTGLATGVAVGTSLITATDGAISGSTILTVVTNIFPKVTLIGNFQDFEGNPLNAGTLLLRVLSDSQSPLGQICAGTINPIILTSGGNIPPLVIVWSTAFLNAGSAPNAYEVRAYTSQGQLVWTSTFTVPDTAAIYNVTGVIPNMFIPS